MAGKVGAQYVLANVPWKAFPLSYFAHGLKPHPSQQCTFHFLPGLVNPAGLM